MAIIWETSELMGTNPASVNMITGDILLNEDVYPRLPKFTQKFILEHEYAHYDLQTDSEDLADKTALQRLYKSEYQSLKKSVKALADFLENGNERIEIIYNEALKLDRMDLRLKSRGTQNHIFPYYQLRADGGESESPEVAETGGAEVRGGRRSGMSRRFVTVMGYTFTVGELLSIGLLVLLWFQGRKK